MWAVGAVGEVGTLLWVVNAVKAQNHTKQEGAPPNADPGGVGGYTHIHISITLSVCISVSPLKRQLFSESHPAPALRRLNPAS